MWCGEGGRRGAGGVPGVRRERVRVDDGAADRCRRRADHRRAPRLRRRAGGRVGAAGCHPRLHGRILRADPGPREHPGGRDPGAGGGGLPRTVRHRSRGAHSAGQPLRTHRGHDLRNRAPSPRTPRGLRADRETRVRRETGGAGHHPASRRPGGGRRTLHQRSRSRPRVRRRTRPDGVPFRRGAGRRPSLPHRRPGPPGRRGTPPLRRTQRRTGQAARLPHRTR